MQTREARRKWGGLVIRIDAAHLGGERNGSRSGRGSENKRPFMAAVSIDAQGHHSAAVFAPITGFAKEAMNAWYARRLEPDAEVCSDGLGAFRAAIDQGVVSAQRRLAASQGHGRRA